MPLYVSKSLNSETNLFVWKITESFQDLFNSLELNSISIERVKKMKSESHQKGFLSVRKLLLEAGYTDFDLNYDQYGKPHLKDGKHISISHSHQFSVIAISEIPIGIDLEIIKEKALILAPRFMDVSHLKNLSREEQIKKATVIWGIKESVFKIKNETGISFIDHIFEHNFDLTNNKCTAELRFNNQIEFFDISFEFIENYVLVCAFKKK